MLMRLDLGFWRTRWREDLFFFFCRGRAIVQKSEVGFLKMSFTLLKRENSTVSRIC